MKMNPQKIASVVLVAVLFLTLLSVWPIPPARHITTIVSPDGNEVAYLYWKPCGLIGMITRDNPWLYLEIRDPASGELVLKRRAWGDSPEDPISRFRAIRNWIYD
jgi:hypothetical protein